MLFYKVDVEMKGPEKKLEDKERDELTNAILSKSIMLFENSGYSNAIVLVGQLFQKNKPLICAAIKEGKLEESSISNYLNEIDLDYKSFTVSEITFDAYAGFLRNSARNGFIPDEDDILEKLNLAAIDRRLGHRDIRFSETVVSDKYTQNQLMDLATGILCASSLGDEITRIYQGPHNGGIVGHPVHYLLQTDNRETRNSILRTLITALNQNDRLQSRRFSYVSYDGDDHLHEEALDALYQSCEGGTMVINYSDDDSNNSEHARPGVDVIAGLCAAMRKHKKRVLTIFCLPKVATSTKEAFLEQLGAITIVPIHEETVFESKAKAYLRNLSKQHGITPNRALYNRICEGKGYNAGDLLLIFDDWHDKQLKRKVYKQYAQLETANRQVATKKPKGNAYQELTRMTGLIEAKAVINQALDFYKAQKLFKEKGFVSERPSMHMVFTGNPGTAKTTVARLFAQIMKDNGLLSIGDLYEVGRADLVGKYVGWTAPLVKKRFAEAKGSVLFIDEAYSLVDDKDGLYGDEAINTIVQEMENNRDDIVVIFAGYPDKMETFVEKNPGLRSRIAFHVPFADYNAQELFEITEFMADDKKMKLGNGVREKLTQIFETAMKSSDFGNGRYVRNLFEKAIMKQATRLVAMDVDRVSTNDIVQFLPDDFEIPSTGKKELPKIGFALPT